MSSRFFVCWSAKAEQWPITYGQDWLWSSADECQGQESEDAEAEQWHNQALSYVSEFKLRLSREQIDVETLHTINNCSHRRWCMYGISIGKEEICALGMLG